MRLNRPTGSHNGCLPDYTKNWAMFGLPLGGHGRRIRATGIYYQALVGHTFGFATSKPT
jgi:hypothetical protein